jgi:hypothetical protein
VEIVFILFFGFAITTGLIGGVKLNMSHIARRSLFRSGALCQYGPLSFFGLVERCRERV